MSNRSIPAFCDTYNAYYLIAEDALWVRLNREPFIDLHLPFQEMDSTFSEWVHPANGYRSNPMGIFNNQKELLIVMNDIGGLYLIFIRVEWDGDPNHLKLTSLHKFNFMQAVVYHSMGSITENFLISLNSGTYKIFLDGSFEKIFDDFLLNFYHWQGELFATGLHELYVSRDEGTSWELLANNFPRWAKFFNVNDKLCIYVRDCLYELDLQNMLLRQIDNRGLETNQITAVCEYQDKIYVTTLSGLYYKEKSDFFTYMESPENYFLIMSLKNHFQLSYI